MTNSFWKQLYEVSWREEKKEGISVLAVLSVHKYWYVISPFVTLHSEIKTDLLP